jgi:hypothetical protein
VSHELQYKIQKESLLKAGAADSQIHQALTRGLNKESPEKCNILLTQSKRHPMHYKAVTQRVALRQLTS